MVTTRISGLLPPALVYASGTGLCLLDNWAETDSWTCPSGEGQVREADSFWAGRFEGAQNCCLQAEPGRQGQSALAAPAP